MLLLEGRGQQVGEEAQREWQRKLHERHQQEEGERDHAGEVGQYADQQVVLTAREPVPLDKSAKEPGGDLGVGDEQLAPVVVVQQHLAAVVVRPRGRPLGGGRRAAGCRGEARPLLCQCTCQAWSAECPQAVPSAQR
eukprot:7391448-Prymnesium_polylepis.2